jgi:hypothetical protein
MMATATGDWRLAAGDLAIRGSRFAVGWQMETGNWQLEAEAGSWKLKLEAGSWKLSP